MCPAGRSDPSGRSDYRGRGHGQSGVPHRGIHSGPQAGGHDGLRWDSGGGGRVRSPSLRPVRQQPV